MTDDATKMKQERDLALAECERLRADAERWEMLPAFLEEYQIDYVKLITDIDAMLAARAKP